MAAAQRYESCRTSSIMFYCLAILVCLGACHIVIVSSEQCMPTLSKEMQKEDYFVKLKKIVIQPFFWKLLRTWQPLALEISFDSMQRWHRILKANHIYFNRYSSSLCYGKLAGNSKIQGINRHEANLFACTCVLGAASSWAISNSQATWRAKSSFRSKTEMFGCTWETVNQSDGSVYIGRRLLVFEWIWRSQVLDWMLSELEWIQDFSSIQIFKKVWNPFIIFQGCHNDVDTWHPNQSETQLRTTVTSASFPITNISLTLWQSLSPMFWIVGWSFLSCSSRWTLCSSLCLCQTALENRMAQFWLGWTRLVCGGPQESCPAFSIWRFSEDKYHRLLW